ncbi:mannitol-1-phosphate 5-dehydrogenase [Lactococcus fujiensis]|uniref:Mannitol-1-phosphate 5-dehydrogenase n=1 Tax=Lactococcus fujiensis JCM 16395 TaxID=1291764 RepID=A0A2A5RJ09_9LACT|nr:mannitol-1-phosphate 5-dehydrogenase [Lactococcus fujiensis]PCR99154.1 mannitol-1-phosphate 5-dehydrogenase [Lactococcus fujiensis JCM 16395]
MKKAVHFGAGNIGRGFIGEILSQNGFEIVFIDMNETVIDALNARGKYEIGIASPEHEKVGVSGVRGINNGKNPEEVVKAISEADVVTTAIGPNILPYIAELIAKGIQTRKSAGSKAPLDIIACENMIGGSTFLGDKVDEYLSDEDKAYVTEFIGFPNAAVDRIVPGQHHEDPLYVEVEPFHEWVIDESQLKNSSFKLDGVHYATDLEPFIERKLFSVNSGHATVAYNSAYKGYKTILEGLQDEDILAALKAVQAETRALLLSKWGEYFTEESLVEYHNVIISRFANPEIIDEVTRVGRTPIRKLGYDERFIRPIRELKAHGKTYTAHLDVVGKIFAYDDPEDAQAVELQEKLASAELTDVIKEVTGLSDNDLITEIETVVKKYAK